MTSFDSSDIRINGNAPTSVKGYANGPWQLDFKAITIGTVIIAWIDGHLITDQAFPPNQLAANSWFYTIQLDHKAGDVVINKFLASNQNGLLDEDEESNDWIELKNIGSKAVNLSGWSLSDDQQKPGK